MVRVNDSSGRLTLKAPLMSHDWTFKIELDMLEHNCLTTEASINEWLWHYKLGHLNFKNISHLKNHNIVLRLLEIYIPDEECGYCVQAKQHKNGLSKVAGSRSRVILEIVYFDVCGLIWVDLIRGNNLSNL